LSCIIAQPAKVLVNFVALNWCKNVVSETGLGNGHKQHSTLSKITYSHRMKRILQDKVIFIVRFHAVHKIIAS